MRDTPSAALLSPGRAELGGHWRRGLGGARLVDRIAFGQNLNVS